MGNSEKLDKLFFNNKYFNCFHRFAQKNNASDQYQCPEWGVLHFYPKFNGCYAVNKSTCQCPEWGDLHFYLASGNPCKSRLCGSIFSEVFQNILKKAFLKGVFWKFTICSYLTVPFLLLVYLFFLGLRSTYSTLLIG